MPHSAIHSGVFARVTPPDQRPSIGPTAPWLLTPYAAHRWYVTDVGDKPRVSINFNILLQDGRLLADAAPHLYAVIKMLVFLLRSGATAEIDSGHVQANVASALITLARWMVPRQLMRFSEVSLEHIAEYADLAAYGTYAIRNVEGALRKHIDDLEAATLSPDDPEELVAEKLRSALPLLGTAERRIRLDERRLLADAGIADVRVTQGLAALLDDLRTRAHLPPSSRVLARSLGDELVSEEHVCRLLNPFDQLHRLRHLLDDGLSFDPFPGSSVRKEGQKRGVEVGRTATMPPKQAMALIDIAVRWVVDYAPGLLHLKEMADNELDQTGATPQHLCDVELVNLTYRGPLPACPFPISRHLKTVTAVASLPCEDSTLPEMPLPVALRHLATACATVIAAFSARRAAEIGGLKVGCIRYVAGKPWLTTFIHKTLQRYTAIPVARCVALAVKVLEDLSERARKHTGAPYIFQMNLPGTMSTIWLLDGLPSFPFGKCLTSFGEFARLPPGEDGTYWVFKPHQFRRFFAIVYVWVYELGDFGALSYHLRHFDLEMTRRYLTEKEIGEIIRWAQKERNATTLARAAMGDRAPASTANGGNLQDRLAIRLHIVPADRAEQRLSRTVERGNVRVRAAEFGFAGFAADNATGTDEPRLSPYVPLEMLAGSVEFHLDVAKNTSSPLATSSRDWVAALQAAVAQRKESEACL
jgi:hypothetical protein